MCAGQRQEEASQYTVPFGSTQADVDAMARGKSSDVPPQVFKVMAEAKPHSDDVAGCDGRLWTINYLSNAHKHRKTILAAAGATDHMHYMMSRFGLHLTGLPFPTWDFEKRRIVLSVAPPGDPDHEPRVGVRAYLAFLEPTQLRLQSALAVLDYMAERVEQLQAAVEAAA